MYLLGCSATACSVTNDTWSGNTTTPQTWRMAQQIALPVFTCLHASFVKIHIVKFLFAPNELHLKPLHAIRPLSQRVQLIPVCSGRASIWGQVDILWEAWNNLRHRLKNFFLFITYFKHRQITFPLFRSKRILLLGKFSVRQRGFFVHQGSAMSNAWCCTSFRHY